VSEHARPAHLWAQLLVDGLRCVLAALPSAGRRAMGRSLGWAWYRLVPIRRGVARAQMQARLGLSPDRAEPLVREMFLRLGGRAVQVFSPAPRWRVQGLGSLEAQVPDGQGVVFVTAHLGQFERLADAGLWRRPVHIVTSHFRIGPLQALWAACRAGRIDGAIDTDDGVRALRAALDRGDALAFMLDQHASAHSAISVDCLGAPAWTSTAPARLAIAASVPLVVVYTVPALSDEVVVIGPALWANPALPRGARVRDLTERAVAALDEAIRAHPADWLWIHRRWKAGGGRAQRLEERRRVRMGRVEAQHHGPRVAGSLSAPEPRGRDAQVEPGTCVEGLREDVPLKESERG